MDKQNNTVIVKVLFDNKISYGFLENETVLFASGTIDNLVKTGEAVHIRNCRLLAPVADGKLIIVASNYTEGKLPDRMSDDRKRPIYVLKPATAVIGPGDDIVYPSNCKEVHYEAEIGVVIGKTAKNVGVKDALNYVLGYTLINDITDRGRLEGQWTFAKGRDTFLPVGPSIWVRNSDEGLFAEGVQNGQLVQRVDTDHLTHSVAELISEISKFMTLLPGDLICSGTSHGGGALKVGDIFIVRHPVIGELRNKVVAE